MKAKIKKLLFESSRNSRITTKELGKKIGTSQQSASYLKKQLIKKKLIQCSSTRVDAVKLGFVNVLVGFNYLDLDSSTKKEILDELKNTEMIIGIEEAREGVDLIVEFCAHNLSAFNKTHSEIISNFNKKIKTAFIFPIIVKHEFQRNYLSRKQDDSRLILSGDRIVRALSKKELQVLNELVKNPTKSLVNISTSLKMPVKTIINIKRSLEKKYVIKGYTSIFDHNKLQIHREILFLRFSGNIVTQIDKFSNYARSNKNIIQFLKIIGASQIGIIIESLNPIDIIKDIRSNFQIENYLIIKSDKIIKNNYIPDLSEEIKKFRKQK